MIMRMKTVKNNFIASMIIFICFTSVVALSEPEYPESPKGPNGPRGPIVPKK